MRKFEVYLYQVSRRLFVLLLIIVLTYGQLGRLAVNFLYLAINQAQTVSDYGDTVALQLLAGLRHLGVRHPLLLGKEAYLLAENQQNELALTLLQEAVRCSPCDESLAAVFNNLATLLQTHKPLLTNTPIVSHQPAENTVRNTAEDHAIAKMLDDPLQLQQRSLQLNPNSAVALYNWGMQLAATDEWQKALPLFEQAAQLDYQWAEPRLQKSLLLVRLGDYTKAEESARQAIALDPTQRDAHIVLVQALYMQQASLTTLLTILDEALRYLPDDDIIQSYRALVLREADLSNK